MFYSATENGNVEEVEEILRNNPNVNVNWSSENDEGSTALIIACDNGHDSIVSILLAHPDIDVNQKDNEGWTPFSGACWYGNTSCVRLMLKDSRVMVNEPSDMDPLLSTGLVIRVTLTSSSGGSRLEGR